MRLFQDNKIYDLNEASSVLKVSKRTLERRVASGDIIRLSDSGNKVKIAGYRLNQYLQKMEKQATEKAYARATKKE